MSKPLTQEEVCDLIDQGESAYGLLYEADPNLISRFNRLATTMKKLLNDTRVHFPDAQYYTASGGFNLMLGDSHDQQGVPQQELVAVGACNGLVVGDGDF